MNIYDWINIELTLKLIQSIVKFELEQGAAVYLQNSMNNKRDTRVTFDLSISLLIKYDRKIYYSILWSLF